MVAQHTFLIYTDHKNIEYLCLIKKPNSPQSYWTLFFARFTFKITYCPCSYNTIADAFSHSVDLESKPILFPQVILALIRWGIYEEINQVNKHMSSP